MKRLPGAALAVACAAIAAAGCGTQVPSARTVQTLAASKAPSSTAAASPRLRAEADAAAILGSFVPPAGARRLPAAPDAAGGALKQPIEEPGSWDLVDDASWWLAPGQPDAVLAWEQAHLPRRFASAGSGEAGGRDGLYEWSDEFSLPPVPAVLDWRELVVQVVSAGANQTAIRVDSQVVWLPAKPAGERVPAGAVSVTLTEVTVTGRRPPVTVTSKAELRTIAALADALPVFPPYDFHCPAGSGPNLELTFRDARGQTLAVVSAVGAGCGTVSFTVGGKSLVTLWHAVPFVQQVLKVAGLQGS